MNNKVSLLMLILCLMSSLALAQTDTATGTVTDDATQARLRIGNFVSSGPRVDVFIDGELAMNGKVPQANMHGFANGYIFLAPGTYSVAVAPARESIEKAELGPLDVKLEAGHRYTLSILDKAPDEAWTPLLIDETAVLQKVRTSPSQSILFLVNNLSGTETINFDQNGEGPKEVAYGGFGAAPITVGQGKTFVYTTDNGEIIRRYGLGDSWYRPEAPSSDFMAAFTGRSPGDFDFGNFEYMESQRTSDLNVVDFLRSYSATGFQHEGQLLSFDTFLSMIEAVGLTEALATGGPHFLYVPTDEAFAALSEEQRDALTADPEAMADVVHYHIVEGYYSYGSFYDVGDALTVPTDTPGRTVITNLLGAELEHRYEGVINGVDVSVILGAMLRNGTRVRVIPQVLLPPTD